MQDSLITVVFVVAVLAGAIAIYLLIASGRVFGEVGEHGLDARDGTPGGDTDKPGEREQDIREMLEARSAHRERRGAAPDLDAELAALLRPPADDSLREEVRELVVARNHRRARNGLEALDVDVEIERRLRELN